MKTRRLHVTSADIRLGQPTICHKDPIALAARRSFHCAVVVVPPYIHVRRGARWSAYRMTQTAADWLARFDLGMMVAPTEIELTRVEEGEI